MKNLYLFPGKIILSLEPAHITTILGSCVAVAIYDPATKMGGLIHYLLDQPGGGDTPSPRYGNYALPALLKMMSDHGANMKRLQAKVYGGASVLGNMNIGKDIGTTNADMAWKILEQYKIPVLEQNTGGTRGRRIVFDTSNFHVKHDFMRETTRVHSAEEIPTVVSADFKVSGNIGIIDPSSALANYFAKMFKKNGFDVIGAASDETEAYSLVYWGKPKILVLGNQEPESEGIKILHQLKKYGKLPTVVLYSFGGQGQSVREALKLGIADYVYTPVRYDPNNLIRISNILMEKIKAFLDQEAA
jgi:two-component system chemotaxis response regulator CheB